MKIVIRLQGSIANPSLASVRRVADALAETPVESLRRGITAATVAQEILDETGTQPSRLAKDDFDCAFADAATV